MIILGIETSCDETAASVIECENPPNPSSSADKLYAKGAAKVLSNVVSSQIEIHKKYGGVIPEVAAREHVLNILPVVNEALERAGIKKCNPPNPSSSADRLYQGGKKSPHPPLTKGAKIDAIAVTVGPGLMTSLLVGVETARSLSYAWGIPLVAVNHIEGHICANFIGEEKSPLPLLQRRTGFNKGGLIEFPALVLTVSGGHNMLVLMKGYGKFKIIGDTLDDAAGEAFDKAAAMLGIGYPGGPAISAEAEKFQETRNKKQEVILPRPMLNSKDFNFSFSGLKTAILYKIQKDPNYKKRIPEYAHEFQQAVIDVLVSKTIRAAKELRVHPVKSGGAGAKQFNRVKTVMLSGGVSANKELRRQLEVAVKEKLDGVNFHMPDLKYTTDNAAMIATAGYFKARDKKFTLWNKIKADPNLELK